MHCRGSMRKQWGMYLERRVRLVAVVGLNSRLGLAGFSNEFLSIQSGYTASASTGDGLAVTLILDVTASEDTLNGSVASTGLSDDVTILIELNLVLDKAVGRVVANSIEQTVSLDNLFLVVDSALDAKVGHQTVGLVLTDNLGGNGVEANIALGVSKETLGHDLRGTELVTTNQDGDGATVFGQEHGLFSGGVTTTNDVQRLVAEDRHSAVADGAGTDTVLPVGLLTGQIQTTGVSASSDNHSIGGTDGFATGGIVPLSPHFEGTLGEIQLGDSFSDNLGTEALRLLAHLLHQLLTADTVRETGEVLDIGGGSELATGSGAIGKHTLVQDRAQFSTRQIDSGCVGGGAGSDNCGRGGKKISLDTPGNFNIALESSVNLLTTLE